MTLPKRTRPLGVSLLALLFLALAIMALGVAAYMLLGTGGNTDLNRLLKRLELPVALSNLFAVPPLLMAGLAGLMYHGLWRQQNWARLGAMVFSFFVTLLAVVGIAFLAAFNLLSTQNLVLTIAAFVISALFFIYLMSVTFPQQGMAAGLSAGEVPEFDFDAIRPPSSEPIAVERSPHSVPPPALVQTDNVPSISKLIPPPPRQAPPDNILHDAETLAPAPKTSLKQTKRHQRMQLTPGKSPFPIAWLVVREGPEFGQRFDLYPGQTHVIGRDPARVDIVLSDPAISGRHAQVRDELDSFILYDLGSTNGTYLGDRKIRRTPLVEGDEIRLGSTTLVFTTTPR